MGDAISLPVLDRPELDEAIRTVRPVFQAIVDLNDGRTVAWEVLARGPIDSALEFPSDLFAAARGAGRVVELDQTVHRKALAQVYPDAGALTLLLNVEPETMARADVSHLAGLGRMNPEVTLIAEVTERVVLGRTSALLRGLDAARRLGYAIALDDVGADRAALALLPFLRPEIVKLDLRLVQQRADPDVAEIINIVNDHAARTGALIIAEGLETEDQVERAMSMGARYGQGWLFGYPADSIGPIEPAGPARATARLTCTVKTEPIRLENQTPFDLLAAAGEVRKGTRSLVVAMTSNIERQAMLLDELTVVLASFASAAHFTSATRRRFSVLSRSAAFVAVLAPGILGDEDSGVHGTSLDADDPLGSWAIAVVGPHLTAALAARPDPSTSGPDARFDYVITYSRDQAVAVADLLLRRTDPTRTPTIHGRTWHSGAWRSTGTLLPSVRIAPGELPELLMRSIADSGNGVAIADARAPDLPLIYVNAAFEELTGHRQQEILGRNARMLQGPDTDPYVVEPIGRLLAAGRPVHATVLNYRKDGTAFWNEVDISPVLGSDGRPTHFISYCRDVSARVVRDQRTSHLAYHDPLTNLPNRAQISERLSRDLVTASRSGQGVAVFFIDLDDFKRVNDRLGHAAGDDLLVEVAKRLKSVLRDDDFLGRLGGDEFVVIAAGGTSSTGSAAATVIAGHLHLSLAEPVMLAATAINLQASIGIARYPTDAQNSEDLLNLADSAMYHAKTEGKNRTNPYSRS